MKQNNQMTIDPSTTIEKKKNMEYFQSALISLSKEYTILSILSRRANLYNHLGVLLDNFFKS